MIKLTRLDPHNLEIRDHDEDGKHRGGFAGPVDVLDAFMLMQEQAQRYRADGLFAAAGVGATTPSERETAYRWWLLGQVDADSANFNVAWAREQARNRQKQEAHGGTYAAERKAAIMSPMPVIDPADLKPIESLPLDTLVSMWLSDQLSWKRYTEELKRRGFKPEEVAAAREEQYLKRGEPEQAVYLTEEQDAKQRAAISVDIDKAECWTGELKDVLQRILART